MNNNPISISKYSHHVSISSSNYILDEIDKYFQKIKKLQFSLPENQIQIKNGLLREFCRIFFNDKKRIEVSLINDAGYNEAIKILSKKSKEYYKILEISNSNKK